MNGRLAPPLIALCLTLIVVGGVLRFVHLGQKAYWYDEVASASRIAGHTWKETARAWCARGALPLAEVDRFRRRAPGSGTIGMVRGLAREEPHHVPLYFALGRFWTALFGDSAAALRSLSAVLGLLAFPALYWLWRELFPSSNGGVWIALALTAVSPFHLHWAQEARPYALWILAILLASAAFLRTLRVGTRRDWALYAGTLVFAFATHLFSAFVVLAHAVHAWLEGRFRTFLLASGAAALLLLPWLLLVVDNLDEVRGTTRWMLDPVPPYAILEAWARHLGRLFLDVGDWNLGGRARRVLFLMPLLMVGGSLTVFVRHAPRRAVRFTLLWILAGALPLMAADLATGGRFSTIARFAIPALLGIQLVVAWAFAWGASSSSRAARALGSAGLVALLAAGLVSSVIYLRASSWPSKGYVEDYVTMGRTVGRATDPIVVVPGVLYGMTMAQFLPPGARIQLAICGEPLRSPAAMETIFLYDPSGLDIPSGSNAIKGGYDSLGRSLGQD